MSRQFVIINLTIAAALSANGCREAAKSTTQPVTEPEVQDIAQDIAANNQPTNHPDIEIIFSQPNYTYTLQEASDGISIEYQLVVKRDVSNVFPYGRDLTGNGPIPMERLVGNDQFYAVYYDGEGAPPETKTTTIKRGSYVHTFEWDGRNWTGPSDWGSPKGGPFPPGEYTLTISCFRQQVLDEANSNGESTAPVICESSIPIKIVDLSFPVTENTLTGNCCRNGGDSTCKNRFKKSSRVARELFVSFLIHQRLKNVFALATRTAP